MTEEQNNQTNPNNEQILHELLPHPDDLLRDQQLLETVIRDPGEIDAKLIQGGVEPDEAHESVERLQAEVFSSIIGPEGLAEGSRTVVEKLAQEAEGLVARSESLLTSIGEELSASLTRSRQVNEDIYTAKRTMQQVRDFLEHGRTGDIDHVRAAVRRLFDFQETYARVPRMLQGAYENAATGARAVSMQMQEGSDMSRRAFRDIAGLEDRATATPKDMYFGGVETKIAERGATTAAAHRDSCDEEVSKYDQFTGTMRNGFDQVSEGATTLMVRLSQAEAVQSLPPASRVGDAIEFLSTSLYRMADYDPGMKRNVAEAYGELERLLRQIEAGMEQAAGAGRRDLELIGTVQQQLRDLRQKAQPRK